MNRKLAPLAAALMLLTAAPAMAQSKGQMTAGIGIHNIMPKSRNADTRAAGLSNSFGKIASTEPATSSEPPSGWR